MTRKTNALDAALKGRKVQTRTRSEIEADLAATTKWAETEGRELPARVQRGRAGQGGPSSAGNTPNNSPSKGNKRKKTS